VIDASLVVEALLDGSSGLADASAEYDSLDAPAHLDIECLNAVRGCHLAGQLTLEELAVVAALVTQMPIERHDITPLVPRIVSLARNATAYDAAYVALAEALDADLLTCDAKFTRVPGITCRVRVL
jgi:predicted nucleic acid-binding protein